MISLCMMPYAVSAKKSRHAKKDGLQESSQLFFQDNILLSFQKWYFAKFSKVVYTGYIGLHLECQKLPKKPPNLFEEAPNYTHFLKNDIFWLKPFKRLILENIIYKKSRVGHPFFSKERSDLCVLFCSL